jgi:DHA2 family multidrug resistance protein
MSSHITPSESSHTMLRISTEAPYYKWLVVGLVLLAEGTATFAGNSVNLALPRLMAAFGTDLATAQWVVSSFLITRTLAMPVLGWLGSILGNRNLFVAIMLIFVIALIGCGLATSMPMLIAFRLIQGLALGPLEGLTAVFLVQTFPPQKRGFALGMRTIGWSLGQIISFTIGGYFIENISWRLIFFLGVPTGILAALIGWLMLPQQREYHGEPVDYPGLLLLAGFLVPLLLVISFWRDDNTTVSILVLLSLGSVVGGGLFILRELLAPFPAVNIRLFRSTGFCLLCGTAFLNSMGLFGAQLMVPIFLQQVIGLTPLQAGLAIVPALAVSAMSGVMIGRLTDILPPPLIAIGSLLTLIGIFYTFSSVTALTPVGLLVVYIMLYRTCMQSVSTPVTILNVRLFDLSQVRMGQGLLGVVRNIGAGLGVAVTSVFFEQRRAVHQLRGYDQYDTSSVEHQHTMGELQQTLQASGMVGETTDQEALQAIQQQLDVEAISAGFRDSFVLVCLCFFLAMGPITWFFIRRYDRAPQGAQEA